ncbi:surface glycoprotein [Trypanosoma conorhini]|uniref:Surface glycoprotein n=1 Tax=Trypanosoma conorhini TaxID=83891 RepID=A0A422MPD4_9TRYP|nr:surface glycoprotein [Trypanosoma conorhini]RNE95071.1 surface glycoprotein [Trypanosoma conorhini]
MCCGILDAVEDCFKFVVAVACCLVLGGPALIIAGSVLLSQDDGRKAYNEAVKEFDPAPINAWTGTINGVPTNVVRKALNVHGASGATSVFAEAVIPVRDPSSTLPVSVNVATVAPFTRYAFFKIRKRSQYECSSTDCGRRRNCVCNAALIRFEDNCRASGGTFTHLPGPCVLGSICGECKQTLYLTQLYLVAQEISKGKYIEDTSLLSAKYDFGAFANDYQPTAPGSVTVRLYSDKDPYIALQRATKGTDKFGPKPRTVGIVLIVLGSLFLLLEIGVCVAIICYCMRRKNKPSGGPSELPVGAPATSGIPGNVPPYSYGQPAQQMETNYPYAQPPPGYSYGQPPPAQGYSYGQPPPAQGYSYGQPPPAQGYSYGQPPPTYPYGQPATAQGYTYDQPASAQGYTYGQPAPAQGYTYGQPAPAQGYK